MRRPTIAGIVLLTMALAAPARAQFGPENAAKIASTSEVETWAVASVGGALRMRRDATAKRKGRRISIM